MPILTNANFRLKFLTKPNRQEDIELPRPVFRDGEVTVDLPDLVLAQGHQSVVAYMESEPFQIQVDERQAGYILERIRAARRAVAEGREKRPLKAILFSQVHCG